MSKPPRPSGDRPAHVPYRLRPPARAGLRPRAPARLRGLDRRARAPARSPAACIPPATAAGSGPCGSTRASAPRPSPTAATATCSSRAPPAFPSPSTCPPRSATTPTIPTRSARWAGWAWPSTAWRTWRRCSTACPSTQVSTSMTINATAAILLALYVAVARRRGIPEARSRGRSRTTSSRSTWRAAPTSIPPAPSLRLVTDLFAYCAEHVPRWNPISISGYHIREAGATAPQEIAFTFAHALEYVRAARAAGLDPDRFGERLSLLLRLPLRLHRGGGEVPGGAAAVGPAHEGALRGRRTRRPSSSASTCRRAA